jgi:hypothetical protein
VCAHCASHTSCADAGVPIEKAASSGYEQIPGSGAGAKAVTATTFKQPMRAPANKLSSSADASAAAAAAAAAKPTAVERALDEFDFDAMINMDYDAVDTPSMLKSPRTAAIDEPDPDDNVLSGAYGGIVCDCVRSLLIACAGEVPIDVVLAAVDSDDELDEPPAMSAPVASDVDAFASLDDPVGGGTAQGRDKEMLLRLFGRDQIRDGLATGVVEDDGALEVRRE